MLDHPPVAPGARVVIRDAEWIVKRVDHSSTGGWSLQVVGVSPIVRDKQARFLTAIDRNIEVLEPADTELVADPSPQFTDTRLYLESLLRQSPPTDSNLYVGHLAAVDDLPYQLDPAIQALDQPRQRILMADATGLGKTIEAGILISELIRRGRGRRILVVTTRSMMTQFQKELWARFTIPLVRLDSVGIERIRADIPTNANPFDYYDKAIVSIDTIKNDAEYRVYLENSSWDVILIDEAQNVAERGPNVLRAKVARLLATRSDTLIMTSATPHDGRPRSFASLMNMLNPTAIADPDRYGPEDIRGLFIRRFKKDIREQVGGAFKKRAMTMHQAVATEAEETAFEALAGLTFASFDRVRRSGHHLFRTVLEKALFSSPAACIETIDERLKKLAGVSSEAAAHDRAILEAFRAKVAAIGAAEFSKYQALLAALRPGGRFGWNPSRTDDRLVVFTERIDTLRFLEARLKEDLHLADEQVATLCGEAGSDVDLQQAVEAFGRDREPVRLLIASDVASEGLNLHYLCHRMIHFDIPWSLMVFQQRNGRIDRYGQEESPHIAYFLTESRQPKIRGDRRILEILIEKDHQAAENIGDPSVFMGLNDEREEELRTGRAIESGQSAEDFGRELDEGEKEDLLALLWGDEPLPKGDAARERRRRFPSLYPDDLAYVRQAVDRLGRSLRVHATFEDDLQQVTLSVSPEMARLVRALPREVVPKDRLLHLTTDRARVKEAIRRCRAEEERWPDVHLLWDLHPVVEWLNLKLQVAFGRRQAPVATLEGRLEAGEALFLVQGEVPNLKGQAAIHSWFAVHFRGMSRQPTLTLQQLLDYTGFGARPAANAGRTPDIIRLRSLLPDVVEESRVWMKARRDEFVRSIGPRLEDIDGGLRALEKRQREALDREAERRPMSAERRRQRERAIERVFADHRRWVNETMTTEEKPYIRIAAVFVG